MKAGWLQSSRGWGRVAIHHGGAGKKACEAGQRLLCSVFDCTEVGTISPTWCVGAWRYQCFNEDDST